jgi:hypothetical protein
LIYILMMLLTCPVTSYTYACFTMIIELVSGFQTNCMSKNNDANIFINFIQLQPLSPVSFRIIFLLP